jgi:hypothetical protein
MTATVPISSSPRLFFERRLPHDKTTRRSPGARADPDRQLVHTLAMVPPYPTTEALQAEGGAPPDSGHTQPWPHGEWEIK